MGYDLVTWTPAIGGGGADARDIVAGSLIKVGLHNFADPNLPLISELNDTSKTTDLNQIIGLYNRRAKLYNNTFGTSLAIMSYLAAGARVSASDFTTLQNNINTLRTTEGFASFTFTTVAAGGVVKGSHVGELRTALRISGTFTPASILTKYERLDNTYGSTVGATESFAYTFSSIYKMMCGKFDVSPIYRWRHLASFKIPEFVSSMSSAVVNYSFTTQDTSLEALDVNLYSSNTDDHSPSLTPAFAGSAYNLDNLEDSQNNPAGPGLAMAIANATVIAKAGTYLSVILASAADAGSSGSSGVSGQGSYILRSSVAVQGQLQIDFGA